MTYCVAMCLSEGLLFASDSRTNAGIDHVATFRKMHCFDRPDGTIVLLNAGNLATTQSVISLLRTRCDNVDEINLNNVPNLYEAANLVGATMREVLARDSNGQTQGQGVDYSCSFLLGGQLHAQAPRLFTIYPQGNFIESSNDTPYFQIGESKYGKPIIDRVVQFDTPLAHAAKCTLISFDSTIKSNLSVGLPIDILLYRRDQTTPRTPQRIHADDLYFKALRQGWGEGLRHVFGTLPDADWFQS